MKDLKQAGFKEASAEVVPRLIVAIDGLEKQGKTHWALTAPDPIGLIDFDVGSEGVVSKFVKEEKKIMTVNIKVPETRADAAKSATEANAVWREFKAAYDYSLQNFRTTIIDTATEAWELLRMARFGKLTQVMPHHYVTVNTEFRRLIRSAYDTDSNLILIHKRKKQWREGSDGKANWTGDYERNGFSDTGFLVQVNAIATRKNGEFHIHVVDCRQNAQCAGLDMTDPMNTFQWLSDMVFEG